MIFFVSGATVVSTNVLVFKASRGFANIHIITRALLDVNTV